VSEGVVGVTGLACGLWSGEALANLLALLETRMWNVGRLEQSLLYIISLHYSAPWFMAVLPGGQNHLSLHVSAQRPP
jgi:hypothetical protein